MRLTDSDSETECNSGSVHQSCTSSPKSVLPSVVRRKRKEEKPLPDPFPLPKNYRPDIEVGLRTGKMSRETKAAFLSSIAAAMFSYKMYPEREEYSRIAYQIVAQYPFLKLSKGSCFVCFMYMYMYLVMLHLFLIHAVLCQAVTDESF